MTKSYWIRLLYGDMTHVKNRFYADVFLADKIISFSLRGAEAAKLLEELSGTHRTSCYRALRLNGRFARHLHSAVCSRAQRGLFLCKCRVREDDHEDWGRTVALLVCGSLTEKVRSG